MKEAFRNQVMKDARMKARGDVKTPKIQTAPFTPLSSLPGSTRATSQNNFHRWAEGPPPPKDSYKVYKQISSTRNHLRDLKVPKHL